MAQLFLPSSAAKKKQKPFFESPLATEFKQYTEQPTKSS